MTSERSAADIYGRDFPAGAVVFEEGDPGSRMYVIQSGSVRIVKRIGSRHLTLATLGPGEAFGEMALLERAPRSATALVETPARILEIDESAFADLVRNNGEVALRLLRRLSARLREANRQIRNFLSADAMGRAVEVLRALSGPPSDDGFRPIPGELAPARLAARVGAPGANDVLWERLRRARLVREVGGHAELAPVEVVEEFLRFVELKPRYHAIAAGELAEVGEIAEERGEGVVAQLLSARLGTGTGGFPAVQLPAAAGTEEDLASEYATYLALKRRFEPDSGVQGNQT